MEGSTAEALLDVAEGARAGMRASDASALETMASHYPALREAMDWCLANDRANDAYRVATALLPFWMATKRIDEGDQWFAGLLERAGGEWPPDERHQHDQTLAALQAAPDPAALDERRAAGSAMTLAEGIAYAMDAAR